MRTMGQKRAKFALQKVIEARKVLPLPKKKDEKDEFKSFAAGAPTMILQNGFGQALAFWLAKGTKDNRINQNDKHIILFDIVREWLSYTNDDVDNNYVIYDDPARQNEKDFILAISHMDQNQYFAAQNETLKLLEWVKRYANAGLE